MSSISYQTTESTAQAPPPGRDVTSSRVPLQRRAKVNSRRHLRRSLVRWSVLIAGDLTVFFLAQTGMRFLRANDLLLAPVTEFLVWLFPGGALGGWKFGAALVIGLAVMGNYGPGGRRRDPSRLLAGCLLAAALSLWHPLWTRGVFYVFGQYVVVVTLAWLGLVAGRFTLDRLVRASRVDHAAKGFAILVGQKEDCESPDVSKLLAPTGEFVAVGFLDTAPVADPDALGDVAELPQVVDRVGADTVILCGYLPDETIAEVVDGALATKCQLLSIPRALNVAGVKPNLRWRHGQPIVELTAPTLNAWQLLLKRTIDILASALGLLILSPVFALVAVAVRIDSRGPIFFRQRRVGQAGKLFNILKFRSMVADAEDRRSDLQDSSIYRDERLFKMVEDPRITRVGAFLRRTSLDELPQLLNVLKGDMSLVGPRPPLQEEVALYEEHHFCRFDVKPGITGPWQVNGRNTITDFEEVIRLEQSYIREWSIWMDLGILLRTGPVVFKMRGAH